MPLWGKGKGVNFLKMSPFIYLYFPPLVFIGAFKVIAELVVVVLCGFSAFSKMELLSLV